MLLIYWYRKNTGMVFVCLYLKRIIIYEALFENEMYWWKRIYYYNINISPFGGLLGKVSRRIVLCALSQNHFYMWKRVWVRLSFKCFNMFTLCKNKCTNWMGWHFDSFVLFRLGKQDGQTKNEIYQGGRYGRKELGCPLR